MISQQIKQAREHVGYTTAQLADKLKMLETTIIQYEDGISTPTVYVLSKIADALYRPLDFFLSEEVIKKEQFLWCDFERKIEFEN